MNWLLKDGPRWLLLVALVYAPWAYGCVHLWAVHLLEILLGTALVLWLVRCVLRGRAPVIPKTLLIAAGLLVVQAWWMVLNAKYDFRVADGMVVDFQWISLEPWLSWAPGSVHRSLSLPMAWHITVLLGAACFVCDLVRRESWRERLLWTMAATGTSLACFGLIQRLAQAPSIFWAGPEITGAFFATFRNYDNAASFLNLLWPICAGLLAAGLHQGHGIRRKLLAGAGLILGLAGVIVSGSRTAAVLGVFLLFIWLAWLALQFYRGRLPMLASGTAAVTGVLVLVLIGAFALLAGLEWTTQRWGRLGHELTDNNPRLLVYRVCLKMVPEAGWWGFGPGTFQTAFPHFTADAGKGIAGRWLYAHQDYFQTMIEWGYLGALLWGVFIFGGALAAFSAYFGTRHPWSPPERALGLGVVTALFGVFLHALVDFPLQVPSIQLYVIVLLGLLWGRQQGQEPPSHSRRWHRRVRPERHAEATAESVS